MRATIIRIVAGLGVLAVALGAAPARAQAPAPSPEVTLEAPETAAAQQQIDLENIVLSAARSVTTVQESPAIITIIPRDEIVRRGFRSISDAIQFVPGWTTNNSVFHLTDLYLTRGIVQSQLIVRDGLSLSDPWNTVQMTARQAMPIELVKRLEIVTGPGGVLWGANSLLGIISVVTRDAADINGIETSASYGDGYCDLGSVTPCGDSRNLKLYGLYGKQLGKLSIVQHASFHTYRGAQYADRLMMAHSASPSPLGATLYGDRALSDTPMSWAAMIDGKYGYGPLSLVYSFPTGRSYKPMRIGGGPIQQHDATYPSNAAGRAAATADGQPGAYCNDPAHPEHQLEPRCADPYGTASKGGWHYFDRFAYLRYRDVFQGGRLTVDAKGFYTNWKHDTLVQVFPGWLPLSQGGLYFDVDPLIHRYGGSVDVDYGLLRNLKLLVGGEAFRESVGDAQVLAPTPPVSAWPYACPWTNPDVASVNVGAQPPTSDGFRPNCPIIWSFAADRVVLDGYVDLQYRPLPRLLLEGGYRAQAGPSGKRTYPLQHLTSAAAVYEFVPNYHLKLNWATGFRPPVILNTDSNSKALAYAPNPDMKPETSKAFQTELNARMLRNVANVRGLTLRADYSYTVIGGQIRLINGRYGNAGDRGLHSGEVMAKLHLKGDHEFYFTYTYLRAQDADEGEMRQAPNHWFTSGAVISLIKNRLALNTSLVVIGGTEDVNRLVMSDASSLFGYKIARFSDQTMDHLPPVANWQIGLRLYGLWKDRLWMSAQVYNALNQNWYYADHWQDFTARLDQRPNPGEALAFFANATLNY